MPDWDNQKALTIFEQMLQKTNNKVDGVLAANDGLGNAAISALKQRKLPQIPVTGQDATLQGIQNIVNGDQCMTVYKAIKKEADAAAELAIALAKGEKPTRRPTPVDNGTQKVPSVLLDAGRGHEGQHQGVRRRDPDFPKKAEICAGKVAAELHRSSACSVRVRPGAPRRGAAPGSRPTPGGGGTAVTDTPVLELRGVSKRFGAVQALHEVDFHVIPGEVMALVGDNGAGKSTLIKCIAGIYPVDGGEILFEGKPVTIHGPKDAARLGHRGRLPGPRAGRQPRRRPEHVPRAARSSTALRRLDETTMEARGAGDARRASRSRRSAPSARRSPASPAASASRSRSPRP